MASEADKKEKLLIEYLMSDKESFIKCYNILRPEYFQSPMDRVVEFTLEHFKKHSGIPNPDIVEAETGVEMEIHEIDNSDRSFLMDEIETHCRNAAMENAILQGADLVSDGKVQDVYELVRNALTVKIDNSIGLELTKNPRERIEHEDENVVSYTCGIPEIDKMMGYFRIEEFYMVYAVTGGGKSLFLGNAVSAFAQQSLDVAVITLELKEELYAKRFDSILSGVDINEAKKFASDIEEYYEGLDETFGNITIKKMLAGSTVHDIEAYLLEYHLHHGKYPDVLVVDYIGLMGVPDARKHFNKFDMDHDKASGIIRLAGQYDMMAFSAGQINREGYEVAKVNPSHCAGGMSLINDSDGAFALVATEEDLKNDQVQGVPLKVRHAARTTSNIVLYKDPCNMRISGTPMNVTPKATNPIERRRQEKNEEESKNKSKLAKALGKSP